MNLPPKLVPEAKSDIADAYLWYEDQCLGLGMDFLRCVEVVLLSIQRTPLIYQIAYATYRRALVRRFPFAIFFENDLEQNQSIVYSVFHCSQSPNKWRGRMP
jgi:hypothetical protein